jgi:3-methyladenine DNA glycosylase AlkD
MNLSNELKKHASDERAQVSQRFFKTGKGQYGEGDLFIGLTVPQTRSIAKQFLHLSLEEIKNHLCSKVHEERLAALMILVEQYRKTHREEIIAFYLSNAKYVNNWDLVDSSAEILGDYLLNKGTRILDKLAQSSNLWERRIAIVSTFAFIKKSRFDETFKIVELLINDKHDLIHKACGWMLREVGKRNEKYLETFLMMHYKKMPRTMLRYAIERFPMARRKAYLKGTI